MVGVTNGESNGRPKVTWRKSVDDLMAREGQGDTRRYGGDPWTIDSKGSNGRLGREL